MLNNFLIISLTVIATAMVLAIGIGLGRYSQRDDIEDLEDRLDAHDEEIAKHIGYEDKIAKTLTEARKDLARERAEVERLRTELAGRQIGARPLWTQLGQPEPLPIDPRSLRYETGTWPTIPRTVSKALELHIGAHRAADYRTTPTFDRREVEAMVDDARRNVPVAPEVTAVDEVLPARRTLVAVKTYPAKAQRKRGKR